MKLTESLCLRELEGIIAVEGINSKNADFKISGINEIHKVKEGDLTFADHPKYIKWALRSMASVVLVPPGTDEVTDKILLYSKAPFDDYNRLVRAFHPPHQHQDQTVSPEAKIHSSAKIFPNVFIHRNVEVGEGSVVYPNVCLLNGTKIGKNVVIGAGSVIGGDAFYYQKKPNGYDALLSCGRVLIEDQVEIGGLCSIDRGVSGDTIIGKGTKMDDQVHIGHGSIIGAHCLIAAQVGIAGKVNIGNNVTIWGQVGISKDLSIADGATILAQSGVAKSIGAGVWFGSPVQPAREKMKELALMKRWVRNRDQL